MGKAALNDALDRATAGQEGGTQAIPGAAFAAIDMKSLFVPYPPSECEANIPMGNRRIYLLQVVWIENVGS
jgi:hypothetical protein